MLKRRFRLRSKADFNRTYKFGHSIRGQFIYLKALKKDAGNTRVAVVVTKKISKRAVVRNRIKRRVIETIRKNWLKLPGGFTIIVVVGQEISKLEQAKIERDILSAITKLSTIKDKKRDHHRDKSH